MSSSDLILSLPLSDLDDLAVTYDEGGAPAITDLQVVATYNWMDTSMKFPTIQIPGVPPCWAPKQISSKPPTLLTDTGKVFLDENAARWGQSPMTPLVAAVKWVQPSFDLECCDVISDRRCLRKLLALAGGEREAFSFDVHVTVGGTVMLMRPEAKPQYHIEPGTRNFRKAFNKAYLKYLAIQSETSSHWRIINYKIGGLNMLVRFQGDAYLKDVAQKEESRTAKMFHAPLKDKELKQLRKDCAQFLGEEPPKDNGNQLIQDDSGELQIRQLSKGATVSHNAIMELSTRKAPLFHKRNLRAQLNEEGDDEDSLADEDMTPDEAPKAKGEGSTSKQERFKAKLIEMKLQNKDKVLRERLPVMWLTQTQNFCTAQWRATKAERNEAKFARKEIDIDNIAPYLGKWAEENEETIKKYVELVKMVRSEAIEWRGRKAVLEYRPLAGAGHLSLRLVGGGPATESDDPSVDAVPGAEKEVTQLDPVTDTTKKESPDTAAHEDAKKDTDNGQETEGLETAAEGKRKKREREVTPADAAEGETKRSPKRTKKDQSQYQPVTGDGLRSE